MQFKILSHAGMLVEESGTKLVLDPWILGSCYWRSWWNYPKAAQFEIASVSYIYLTHLHWDHFHGPSLRRFPKTTTILIPKAPSTRILDDILDFEFKELVELPHAKPFKLAPHFTITSYQFGLAFDSVLAIEGQKTTLVDMNDCKMAGKPFRQLVERHPKVDFMFRSHSSAQPYPLCVEAEDEDDLRYRKNEDYVADFVASARILRSKYAVPFASNHCFLHKDTFRFNGTVVNPLDVKTLFDQDKAAGAECVVMVAGDAWDEHHGFRLQDQDFFTRREQYLQEYAREEASVLENYYRREDAVKVTFKAFDAYFTDFMKSIPWFLRFVFKPVVLFEIQGKPNVYWVLDFARKRVFEASGTVPEHSFRIRTHPAILRDCVQRGMFTVFFPSKRLTIFMKKGSVKDYFILYQLFELYEYRFLPLRKCLTARFVANWLRRWREVIHMAALSVRVLFKRGEGDAVAEFVPKVSL